MFSLKNFLFLACTLTYIVILMGAFTRITDSGLGCPDWPFCYGKAYPQAIQQHHLSTSSNIAVTSSEKAWIEMIHRYLAFSLGIVILGLFLATLVKYHHNIILISLACCTLFTVIIQAMLGMFTVTLQLHALSVSLHLLFALLLLSLLTSWYLKLNSNKRVFSIGIFIGLLLVFIQIFIGANVSATYSALACPNLPLCPLNQFNLSNIAKLFITIFQHGELSSTSERINLQMLHRLFGAILLFYFIGLYIYYHIKDKMLSKHFVGAVLVVLILQIIFGMINVIFHTPIAAALLHTAMAALLIIMLTCGLFLREKSWH